ncbi:MAG: ATP12 family protein [Hyphomicrobiales bacterium]
MNNLTDLNKKKIGILEEGNKIYLTFNGIKSNIKNKKNIIIPNAYIKKLILDELSGKYNQNLKISMISIILKYSANSEDTKKFIIPELLKYLETDLLFYRVNSPESLANAQKTIWDNALDEFNNIFSTNWKTTTNLNPIKQNHENITIVEDYLVSLDNFILFIMFELIKISGSCILTILVVLNKIKLEQLWKTIYVDELFNNEIYQDVNKKNELKIKKDEIAFFMQLINSIQN